MNPAAHKVRNKAVSAWNEALVGMQQMETASSARPDSGWQIVAFDDGLANDVVGLNFGPVVLNVPTRANSGRTDLYVAMKGWIVFEGDLMADLLKTRTFGTDIGYFQKKGDRLQHVYGAHYDMDEVRPGHPVFHAQIGAQMDLGQAVKEQFKLDCEIDQVMGRVLKNVRTPSAQMDVFAVLTQICADHLVGEAAPPEVKTAFSALRNASDFFVGAAHRLDYLNTLPATGCYRSKYWYDAPEANA